MKTRIFRNIIQFALFLIVTVFTLSCETEIPPEDPTPPTFSFQVSGNGFNADFNQDTDVDRVQLNLKSGETYQFIYTVVDAGGVEQVQMFTEGSAIIQPVSTLQTNWSYRVTASLQNAYQWSGDRNNPLNGTSFEGNFRINGDLRYTTIRFNMEDFGGNRVTRELLLFLYDGPEQVTNRYH